MLNYALMFLDGSRDANIDGLYVEGLQVEGLQAEGFQAERFQAEGLQAEGLHVEGLQAGKTCLAFLALNVMVFKAFSHL